MASQSNLTPFHRVLNAPHNLSGPWGKWWGWRGEAGEEFLRIHFLWRNSYTMRGHLCILRFSGNSLIIQVPPIIYTLMTAMSVRFSKHNRFVHGWEVGGNASCTPACPCWKNVPSIHAVGSTARNQTKAHTWQLFTCLVTNTCTYSLYLKQLQPLNHRNCHNSLSPPPPPINMSTIATQSFQILSHIEY